MGGVSQPLHTCMNLQTQMEVAKEKASEFEQCYKALGAKLSSYDGMQKQQAPICSDAVGLKRQLAEHKVWRGEERREHKVWRGGEGRGGSTRFGEEGR